MPSPPDQSALNGYRAMVKEMRLLRDNVESLSAKHDSMEFVTMETANKIDAILSKLMGDVSWKAETPKADCLLAKAPRKISGSPQVAFDGGTGSAEACKNGAPTTPQITQLETPKQAVELAPESSCQSGKDSQDDDRPVKTASKRSVFSTISGSGADKNRKDEEFHQQVSVTANCIMSVLSKGTQRHNGLKITDVRSFWRALDRDGDGQVDRKELYDGFTALGVEATEDEVDQFFTAVDVSLDGTISEDELVQAMSTYSSIVKRGEHSQHKLEELKRSIQDTASIDLSNTRSVRSGVPNLSIEHLKNMTKHEKEVALDIVMVIVILVNAMCIGVSMDYEYTIFAIVDIIFTVFFILDLFYRWHLTGFKHYFQSFWNWADCAIIVADVSQLVLASFLESSLGDSTPPASLFRVARLVRLGRLTRLIRLEVFEDLIAMISGIMGGMTTLMWSIVMFIMIVFITSLLFREFFGRGEYLILDEDIPHYFSSVPRSMFTTFRYFFGDFTTLNGLSLFECIQVIHGTGASFIVSFVFFIVFIGVFNVIAAIFVESTMAAANALRDNRKIERMNDPVLWSSRIKVLIRKLFHYQGTDVGPNLFESLEDLAHVPVMEEDFAKFIQDDAVIQALDHLEIDAADHKFLFDILDNDNTGSIIVSQLVDGLRRLRGNPRRSDIITVDLMVRAIQEQTNILVDGLDTALDRLSLIVKRVLAAG